MWVFHGGRDNVVPVEDSRRIIECLKATGATGVRLTVVEDAGHDCWTDAYNDVELWKWMLEQHRDASA